MKKVRSFWIVPVLICVASLPLAAGKDADSSGGSKGSNSGDKGCTAAPATEDIKAKESGPEGNLRYSITVSNFENKSNWRGHWDVGYGFTEIMTHALNESGRFIVLGDKEMRFEALQEQDFAASGRAARGKKAPKIGRMTPAQLLVKGAITHVQHSTTGGGGNLSFKGSEHNFFRFTFDAPL
jgi:curli biogenesis system outer membrane secretion channel CsgG